MYLYRKCRQFPVTISVLFLFLFVLRLWLRPVPHPVSNLEKAKKQSPRAWSKNNPWANRKKTHGSGLSTRWVETKTFPDTHLLPVNVFNLSFFVSAKHHQWVLKNERGCLAVVDRALSLRKGNCTTFDIGMNDGFYTQLFGAYGCKTFSYELHPECISISQKALQRNGFSHLVNISQLAVSDTNNTVSAPKSLKCDGSLSISRQSSQVPPPVLEVPICQLSHMTTCIFHL